MAVCSELGDKSSFNSPIEAKSPISNNMNAPFVLKHTGGAIKQRREAKQEDKNL